PEFGAGTLAVERQLEPAGPLWLRQVVQDALDRRPGARPDDLVVRLFEIVPARPVVLIREVRLGFGLETDREDGRCDDPVDRWLVELVDQDEVVERLDVGRPEPGLLSELAQRPARHPLAGFERSGHALPQPGQDPTGRPADEQDLRVLDSTRRRRDAKHPAIDEVRAEGAHRRSKRSTGRTNTVAPPTSTSSG